MKISSAKIFYLLKSFSVVKGVIITEKKNILWETYLLLKKKIINKQQKGKTTNAFLGGATMSFDNSKQ